MCYFKGVRYDINGLQKSSVGWVLVFCLETTVFG